MQSYFWLLICVLLITIELATMGLTTIWFAAGSLGAYAAAVMGGSFVVQLLVLVVISFVLLIFTRPVALKYLKSKTRTNVDEMIGKTAVVTEDVNNLQGQGAAKVNGLIWTARSTEDNIHFTRDDLVDIVKIQGNKLIVKAHAES